MYKDKILRLLRSSPADFLSGEELARKTGISRTMVWKHIKSLEQEGFGIEAVPSQGYRILSEPDTLRKSDILQGLRTKFMGRTLHLHPAVASTNTLAMEMASLSSPEGTVVIAETQTAGKGRIGRTWISPKGNLYFSVVLKPNIQLQKAPLLTLMGAVAVASTVRTMLAQQAVIKWPNDVLIGQKKISGLLTEMSAEQDRIKYIVLGIGLNVNMDLVALPSDVRRNITTVATETGKNIRRTPLLCQLLLDLEHWYRVFLEDEERVLSEWKKLNVTIGNRVTVRGLNDTLEGLAQGIDREGRLIITLDDGRAVHVASGDVTLKPAS